jgi:hypothetical protein
MSDFDRNVFGSLFTMMVTIVVILILLGVAGMGVIILSLTAGA